MCALWIGWYSFFSLLLFHSISSFVYLCSACEWKFETWEYFQFRNAWIIDSIRLLLHSLFRINSFFLQLWKCKKYIRFQLICLVFLRFARENIETIILLLFFFTVKNMISLVSHAIINTHMWSYLYRWM